MNLVGALIFFLDFLVKQLKDGIFLFQDKYAKELVKKFMLDKTKNTHTPMRTSIFFSQDPLGKDVDQTLYRSTIESLHYLSTSHPNISFSIDFCTRFQSFPKESNIVIIKRVINYVNKTSDLEIWFPIDTTTIKLVMYSDANWAICNDHHKNTLGGNLGNYFIN